MNWQVSNSFKCRFFHTQLRLVVGTQTLIYWLTAICYNFVYIFLRFLPFYFSHFMENRNTIKYSTFSKQSKDGCTSYYPHSFVKRLCAFYIPQVHMVHNITSLPVTRFLEFHPVCYLNNIITTKPFHDYSSYI